MNIPPPSDAATELDRIATALDWAISRDDWWGPARLAFDAEVGELRDTAHALSLEARELP